MSVALPPPLNMLADPATIAAVPVVTVTKQIVARSTYVPEVDVCVVETRNWVGRVRESRSRMSFPSTVSEVAGKTAPTVKVGGVMYANRVS